MSTSILPAPTVNVRLCGSIPRNEMSTISASSFGKGEAPPLSHGLHPRAPPVPSCNGSSEGRDSSTHQAIFRNQAHLCSQLERLAQNQQTDRQHNNLQSTTTTTIPSQNQTKNNIIMPHQQQQTQPLHHTRSIPNIEAPSWAVPARGDARLEPICDCLQTPVNLGNQAVFRIGRSPSNDVQLLHATSSRRHAFLFHHSNGSCYLVDCGSAHGTYVNGVRIFSKPQQGGVVIPHKIRRGSMIRFGGEGAPCFMLKSFSFRLDDLSRRTVSPHPANSPISQRSMMVQNNTRFNALGPSAKDLLAMLNSAGLSSKRSFDSMDTLPADSDEDEAEPCSKRMRCSSPPPQEQEPMRLVSPEESPESKRKRRVTFSSSPPLASYPNLVSPNLSTDEDDGPM